MPPDLSQENQEAKVLGRGCPTLTPFSSRGREHDVAAVVATLWCLLTSGLPLPLLQAILKAELCLRSMEMASSDVRADPAANLACVVVAVRTARNRSFPAAAAAAADDDGDDDTLCMSLAGLRALPSPTSHGRTMGLNALFSFSSVLLTRVSAAAAFKLVLGLNAERVAARA